MKFVVFYRNSGKSPALDFGDNEIVSYIDIKAFTPKTPQSATDSGITTPARMLNLGENNPACEKATPIVGGIAVFPGDHDSELHRSRPLMTTADITSGKGNEIMLIHGCFAYLSFGEMRQTAFCYYADPNAGVPFGQWPLRQCPNGGNYAN